MSTVSLYKELNFGLGETADMIRDHVNSFATSEIAPLAEKTDQENAFPNEMWPKFGEMDYLGSPSLKNLAAQTWVILNTLSQWKR